ncbi:MAG TPA: PIN domain-containing protein [Streptosporangiaceae bacterium]|nr:PIN domain-containing protein [Streptosporangiaceae bacterium]
MISGRATGTSSSGAAEPVTPPLPASEALPVDEQVSDAWALLVSQLRAAGQKVPINDSWIAATALAHGIPVVTHDADFDLMPGAEVMRI